MNYTLVQPTGVTADITAKALTISGITASDKEYDGGTTSTVDATTGLTLTGLVNGDDFTVTSVGTFSDKNVGAGKTVTLANTLGGSDLNNYTVTDQTSTTAEITAKALTISGITVSDKEYDGGTTSTVDATTGLTLTGLVTGDDFTVTSVGTFSDKNVGAGKIVTLANTLGGADLNNYTVTDQTSTTAEITAKALTISGITASDKEYDGGTTSTVDASTGLTLTGLAVSYTHLTLPTIA